MATENKASPDLGQTVDDIFSSLDLQDKQASGTLIDTSTPDDDKKRDDQRRMGPPPRRPPHQSGDSESRIRRPAPPRPNGPPGQQRPSRPRRNSDSSTFDFDAQPITEEEKKLIQQKRLDEMRKAKPQRKHRGLDIIDQLDCTGLYTVHHDGPFDAVTSHRNRKGSQRAPMQAFPEGSLNNSLGGSGPLNARADHSTFMGNNDDEAFRDFSTGAPNKFVDEKGEVVVFDSTSRGDAIHGDESVGLGTSTFLAGAPASRVAIEKREQEIVEERMIEGLQRKKSLAQRIRHINKGGQYGPGRMERERAYSHRSPDGRIAEEQDPFDEYSRGGSEQLSVSKPKSPPLNSNPFDAPRGLERRGTSDSFDTDSKPTGILGRMKSLRGGKRRPSDAPATLPGPAV